jgi:prevent-host-death family protein
MKFVGIKEGKTALSELVRRANAGERIVFTTNGQPAAVLGPFNMDQFEEFLIGQDEMLARGIAESRVSGKRYSSAEARAKLGVPPRPRKK